MERTVSHATWNLGWTSLERLPKGIREAELLAKQKLDIISLQEVPRTTPGWTYVLQDGWAVHPTGNPALGEGTAFALGIGLVPVGEKSCGTWHLVQTEVTA